MVDEKPGAEASTAVPPRAGLLAAAGAALVLAAVSTLGDWIWARFLTDGSIVAGVLHGVVFFAVLALVLAFSCPVPRRALAKLLPTLPLVGLLIAAGFYPLARAFGYLAALLVAWVAMWLALAFLHRTAGGRAETHRRALLRATLAALGSGLAFWAVADMWTQPAPDGPHLLEHLGRWFVAFLPGMLALICCSRSVAEASGHPRGKLP